MSLFSHAPCESRGMCAKAAASEDPFKYKNWTLLKLQTVFLLFLQMTHVSLPFSEVSAFLDILPSVSLNCFFKWI